jgi:hypothetical protein
MQVLRLIRTGGALEHEYGRVVLDEGQAYFKGFSSVFASWLANGVNGSDGRKHLPSEGLDFLRILQAQFPDGSLKVTYATEE